MSIGTGELLLVILVVSCMLGPDKAEEAARLLGKGLRILKKASAGLREELQEAAEPVREVMEPVSEWKQEIEKEEKEGDPV